MRVAPAHVIARPYRAYDGKFIRRSRSSTVRSGGARWLWAVVKRLVLSCPD
jgi:hypothetical protein